MPATRSERERRDNANPRSGERQAVTHMLLRVGISGAIPAVTSIADSSRLNRSM
jgi:hypothetical protein